MMGGFREGNYLGSIERLMLPEGPQWQLVIDDHELVRRKSAAVIEIDETRFAVFGGLLEVEGSS